MFQWGLIATPLTIASFVAGLPWGATGVAAAYCGLQLLFVPMLYAWATRASPVRSRDLYMVLIPTLAGGGFAWLILSYVRSNLSTPVLLLAALSLSYGLSVAFQSLTSNGRASLVEMIRLVWPRFRQNARADD